MPAYNKTHIAVIQILKTQQTKKSTIDPNFKINSKKKLSKSNTKKIFLKDHDFVARFFRP